ncbi:MAG: hypothetical protein R3D02_08745 [Hyphomicrobiales bacterium]
MSEIFSPCDGWRLSGCLERRAAGELAKIGFNSTIGYGFKGEPAPRGVLVIENGHAVAGGPFNGEALNWDLRADKGTWEGWLQRPPGMMVSAWPTPKTVVRGRRLWRDGRGPRMAGPFMKSFAVMARV